MWKKILLLTCCFLLTACETQDKNILKVGTIAGPETQLTEVAAKVATAAGLQIKIVEFTDYIQPNAALNDGSIDVNVFQHTPYLAEQIKTRHYNLVAVGKTLIYPMRIYSSKIKTLQAIPKGAIIAIPNDPSNEGRALLLLQKAGLIKLKAHVGLLATPNDIQANPQQLVFKELDAAQLARSLPDVTAAAINTNYAMPAGLTAQDAIFTENTDSPYANLIVVRSSEMHDPRIKQFVAAFHSEAVKQAAQKIFHDQAIPAW